MKPNLPDEIWLGKPDYSMWTDWQVNGWLFAATLLSATTDILLPQVVDGWPLSVRVALAVLPFGMILLWARKLTHWIRGMDELHSRLTLVAILFATNATFFFVTLWHRLVVAGLFPTRPGASWDIHTVGHIFLLMTFFYFLGFRIFNRRYQ